MTKGVFPIVGMHCASCKVLIENTVTDMDGVKMASVNYATEKMTLEYDDSVVELSAIAKVIAGLGSYQMIEDEDGEVVLASPPEAAKVQDSMTTSKTFQKKTKSEQLKQKIFNDLKRNVLIIGIASIPFMILMLSMGLSLLGIIELKHDLLGYLEFSQSSYKINLFFVAQFLLATPILFIGGKELFKSAWMAFKSKTANMDTLVVIGTSTAWAYSTVITFMPSLSSGVKDAVFFEASVFIVFFIMLGRLLEAKAKRQANDSIKKLLELQAKEALVIRDGKEVLIPISEVQIGEIIIVKPGQKVPVDGEITKGASSIDESMITGESMPIDKTIGDKVIGATINKSSTFEFKAGKIGADTMLSQIIKLVEEAQGSSAPIQRLADSVSKVFVPVVVMIAVLVFIFWMFFGENLGLVPANVDITHLSFYIATTVLIIACPCALGLATPTAVMVGTGKAASMGILIKDAQALELAHKIDTIVFDKTGTLTEGKPKVVDFTVIGAMEITEILEVAYAIEKLSEHPLSQAIEDYAIAEIEVDGNIEITEFLNNEGLGVTGVYNGNQVAIGNLKLIKELGAAVSKELQKEINTKLEKGNTVVIMLVAGKITAIISIADTIKESSASTISQLHKLKIKTVMLTGDNEKVANEIASKLGIDEIIADVLPGQKADLVKNLQSANEGNNIVAMVGDGINDAPALAQADIGIAMGTGTDIAMETGDIVLVNGSLDKVLQTIKLSRSTLTVIKQNLAWAFGYNILAIPIAAGILYPAFGVLLSPVIASAAMAFSSVSVVLNSLRLKRVS